jgi:hypothetical protein
VPVLVLVLVLGSDDAAGSAGAGWWTGSFGFWIAAYASVALFVGSALPQPATTAISASAEEKAAARRRYCGYSNIERLGYQAFGAAQSLNREPLGMRLG